LNALLCEIVEYNCNYPDEPIGGGNPYHRCSHCKVSTPEINGRLEGHAGDCEWRIEQEGKLENRTDKADDDMSLAEKYEDARNMIDVVYELVEILWVTKGSPYNKKIKEDWLRKARDIHGAVPMP